MGEKRGMGRVSAVMEWALVRKAGGSLHLQQVDWWVGSKVPMFVALITLNSCPLYQGR